MFPARAWRRLLHRSSAWQCARRTRFARCQPCRCPTATQRGHGRAVRGL